MPDHAELAEVEGHEDTDDVELDQLGRLGVEDDDQQARHRGQEDDAVAVGEPVAARAQRPRGEAVLGQDRAEHRKAVEGSVGGEHQDDAGDGDDEVEAGREVVEDAGGDLRDHRVLVVARRQRPSPRGPEPLELVGVDVADHHLLGEHDDAHHHRDRDQAEHQQCRGGVAALGLAEGRYAVADRLDARQGGAAGGEGTGQQEHQADLRQRTVPPLGGHDLQPGALGHRQVPGQQPQQAIGAHAEDRRHEQVGRDREERARLADATQVHRGQQRDGDHTHRRLVADESFDAAGGVLGGRGDRHGDREHVVDQQRTGHRHPGVAAQVDRRDLVVAAAGGVGVHRLAIARDDRQHHHRHRETDLPRPDVRRRAGDGQHDEDLVGRVGHRGQGVAGEDGQRDPLGQQRLPQLAAAQLATQEDALGDIADTHRREA